MGDFDVTELLKRRANDMADGIHMIDALKSPTVMAKNIIDYYHEMWYKEASELRRFMLLGQVLD